MVIVKKYGLFKNDSGMAATEFALLLPIMGLLFFGALEVSEVNSVNDRVNRAATMLSDLSTLQVQISPEELDQMFFGITQVIQPISNFDLEMQLVHVIPDPMTGQPIVEWSRSNDSGNPTPYAHGDPFTELNDPNILRPNLSILYAIVKYEHERGLTGKLLSKRLHFEEDRVRMPRLSNNIDLCTLTPQGLYINCI